MRFVRYLVPNEEPSYGWISNDMVGNLTDSPLREYRRLDVSLKLTEVKLLSPIIPNKIIGVGRNYAEHAREQNSEIPEYPIIFLKPPTSIIGTGEIIRLPPQSQRVEHEAELAVVIGKTGRWIPLEKAQQFIFGYTIGNDVTARDLQSRDGQWTRAKGFDTFCPLGPWIESDLDTADLLITCHVNGKLRQMSSTKEMIFSIPQLITYISSIMTLEVGDVILTGTPAGVDELKEGDEIEISIDGIGTLKNRVRQDKTASR